MCVTETHLQHKFKEACIFATGASCSPHPSLQPSSVYITSLTLNLGVAALRVAQNVLIGETGQFFVVR